MEIPQPESLPNYCHPKQSHGTVTHLLFVIEDRVVPRELRCVRKDKDGEDEEPAARVRSATTTQSARPRVHRQVPIQRQPCLQRAEQDQDVGKTVS